MRQIDGPGVVKRHSVKKRVNSQRQKFELASRDLRHGVPSLLLMVNAATPILAAGINRKIETRLKTEKLTKCGLRSNCTARTQPPECLKGKVYGQKEPALRIRLVGQAPIAATVYELERLRCNLCGEIFEAEAPESVGEKKYNESAAAMKIPGDGLRRTRSPGRT